jgi:hypothetical protein
LIFSDASDNNILHPRHDDVPSSNKTKSLLLQKLIPNGIHGNKGRKYSNIQVNVHKRSIERWEGLLLVWFIVYMHAGFFCDVAMATIVGNHEI